MERKHSYRTLAKRRFAGWILFYLKDVEDAKTIFKYSNGSCDKEIKSAYETAETLITAAKAGKQVNVSTYAPHVAEITNELKKFTQPVLFN